MNKNKKEKTSQNRILKSQLDKKVSKIKIGKALDDEVLVSHGCSVETGHGELGDELLNISL